MIKIAYIVSTLKRTGPINQLSYIIKYLDNSKFEPVVITLSSEPQNSLKDRFDKLRIKHISLNLSRIEGIFKAKEKLKDILKNESIEIVHTQGIRADILASKYLQNYKRISTLRNYPYHDYPMKFGKIKGYLMAHNHIKATKKITRSIACSKSISDIYLKEKNIKVSYIQNGVDQEIFGVNFEKKDLRKKLSLPENKKIFISVGSLICRKDPITIIEAFKKNKQINKSELIFLGSGPLIKECKEAIEGVKNIKLIGDVKNVSEYLQASDYFVSASLSEGLPNTVMEAMSCGLPCILSDIPSHFEIIEIDTKSSFIFKSKNIDDLKVKMELIMAKDYEIMKNASLNTIESQLNAKNMSKQYQKLYLKIQGDN